MASRRLLLRAWPADAATTGWRAATAGFVVVLAISVFGLVLALLFALDSALTGAVGGALWDGGRNRKGSL